MYEKVIDKSRGDMASGSLRILEWSTIMRFKGLIKSGEEPKIKIENNELYIVIPEKAKVK